MLGNNLQVTDRYGLGTVDVWVEAGKIRVLDLLISLTTMVQFGRVGSAAVHLLLNIVQNFIVHHYYILFITIILFNECSLFFPSTVQRLQPQPWHNARVHLVQCGSRTFPTILNPSLA